MAEDYELRKAKIFANERGFEGFWISQGGHPSEDGVNKVFVPWEESERLIKLIVANRKLHEAESELYGL